MKTYLAVAVLIMLVFLSVGRNSLAQQVVVPPSPADSGNFDMKIQEMQKMFLVHFLADVKISVTSEVEKRTVFGEPNPPEGFAGPDPDGKMPLGIYLPPDYQKFFLGDDISVYQWVFHEMFHLHNRRLHDYDQFIKMAYPTGHERRLKRLLDDPYHKTFAAEEEFITLVTFADPAKTPGEIRGYESSTSM